MKIVSAILALILLTAMPATANDIQSSSAVQQAAASIGMAPEILNQSLPISVQNAACCRVCTKGKACGDSCINRSYTCTKGPGCACDGYMPEPEEPPISY